MKRNILIVSGYPEQSDRSTLHEHLYSFQKYASENISYLNLYYHPNVPKEIAAYPFDLIIFHTLFLANHWSANSFHQMMRRAGALKTHPAVKVMLPQDEFYYSDLLSEFINEFSIDIVFTVIPDETQWQSVYRYVDFHKVRFVSVLNGYIDNEKIDKFSGLSEDLEERPIDIGYRTLGAYFWYGRHGNLKVRVANLFRERAPQYGLKVEIPNAGEDIILGEGWYSFLARCKYVIGVMGGTSVIDPDGSIRRKTEDFLDRHPGLATSNYLTIDPDANFEWVEAACFPGLDGTVNLFLSSPRLLDAALTRTCQVLVEADYERILGMKPGVHYIELKKDFSNLDEVLELIVEDRLRRDMVARTYQDVVASGQYTYKSFVGLVLRESLQDRPPQTEQPLILKPANHITKSMFTLLPFSPRVVRYIFHKLRALLQL